VRAAIIWAALCVATGCGETGQTSSSGLDSGGDGPSLNVYIGEVDPSGCLLRGLPLDDSGQAGCKVLEAQLGVCNCSAPARVTPEFALASAVRKALGQSGACDQAGAPRCDDFCVCELAQLSGASLASCQNDAQPSGDGWCAIDPSHDAGGAGLLVDCPASTIARLRFVGSAVPTDGARLFVTCG
jgi:hypothetical protein